MQQIYYHIPATGWSRLTNRDDVPANIIDGARQLLAARKGRLGPFRVDVRRLPGGAVYDVRCKNRLMTTCGLALDDAASPAMWRILAELPRLYGPVGDSPPQSPWLSVVVYPPFFDANDLTITMLQLAQLAVAWVLLDEPTPFNIEIGKLGNAGKRFSLKNKGVSSWVRVEPRSVVRVLHHCKSPFSSENRCFCMLKGVLDEP
ncbi:MAG: hypothetical protein ACYC35_00020 [Pirellulales bacterium]